MAGYSIVSKAIIKQVTERSLAAENKETINVSVEHIDQLFEQFTQLLTNTENINTIISVKSILSDLNQICCYLADNKKEFTALYALNIFILILKHNIKLFDTDQFVQIITHHYSTANNDFLRSFLDIIDHYDTANLPKEMTPKARRELFLSLLDIFSTSTRMVSFLQNKLLITSDKDNTNRTIINFCGSVLHIVLQILACLMAKVTGNEIEKYQNTLFTPFIIFLGEYFEQRKYSRVNEQYNELLIVQLLSFIWNTTDKTSTIPIFINANCPQACLQWLSLSSLNGYEYNSIINILNNIARHDEGAMILKKSDCAKTIRQFQDKVSKTKIEFIINEKTYLHLPVFSHLILALVLDSSEFLSDDVKNVIINDLLRVTKIASGLSQFRWEGLHISEPLIALMNLCVHDTILRYVLQQDQLPRFFFTTLRTLLPVVEKKTLGDDYLDLHALSFLALANILWSISFHDQYRNVLIENHELLKTLKAFSTTGIIDKILSYTFIPYRMLSLTKVIDGIWQNLYPSVPSKLDIDTSTTTTTLSKDNPVRSLMISYSYINIEFCQQLYDRLNKDPILSISVNTNNSKYLWKEITQTVEQSDIVLFLISKDFFHSKSCRQELIYATDTLKKTFIPVFIDPEYKTTGWLDKRIVESKHFRFGTTDFLTTCNALLSMIHESLSMNKSSVKKSSNIKQWNDKEVRRWFTINNLLSELYDFYQFRNGDELLSYAGATLPYPWINEYDRIRLRFEEKFKQQERNLSSHEFLKFIHALERLKNKSLSSS